MMPPGFPFWYPAPATTAAPAKPRALQPARFFLAGTGTVTATGGVRMIDGALEYEVVDDGGRRIWLAAGDAAVTGENAEGKAHQLVAGRAA